MKEGRKGSGGERDESYISLNVTCFIHLHSTLEPGKRCS